MKSKYQNRCANCGQMIWIGDEIGKDFTRNKWVHIQCVGGADISLSKKTDLDSLIFQSEANSFSGIEDTETSFTGKTDFVPSPYQEKIFDFVANGKGNAVVEAVAGSGKTTTIVKALELTKPTDKVAFLAFNKHIATELKKRAPDHVHVSTIHSLGYSVLRKLEQKPEIDNDKTGTHMDSVYPIDKSVETSLRIQNRQKRGHLRKLVSLCKATLIDYENVNEVNEMCERYGIDMNGETDEIISNLPVVMKSCEEDLETIDFDDMIYLPLVNKRLRINFEKFDFLFIDEAQDLNKSQIEFVMNSLQPQTGRIIAVGDRKQSLYGFRGADVEAIPRLIKMLDATVLPLSISYRCPKSVVAKAKEIVPQIESSETAPDGEILEIKYDTFLNEVQAGDMVICRTNAPLVKPAFEVIRRGTKSIIRGKDIGSQLVNFVERFQAVDLSSLEVMMAEYSAKEYQRLLDRGKELAAEMVMDKLETIRSVSMECRTVSELTTKLDMLFSDSNIGVVFSSIHRSKGLEADKVYILKPEIIRHPKAKFDWELEQEANTEYVAITRSKSKLIYVKDEE